MGAFAPAFFCCSVFASRPLENVPPYVAVPMRGYASPVVPNKHLDPSRDSEGHLVYSDQLSTLALRKMQELDRANGWIQECAAHRGNVLATVLVQTGMQLPDRCELRCEVEWRPSTKASPQQGFSYINSVYTGEVCQ